MATQSRRPLVGIPASIRQISENDFHSVSVRYITAITKYTEAEIVIIPAIGRQIDFESLIQRVDGLVFTGCPSNIEPYHYGVEKNLTPEKKEPNRDATTLPMIRSALANAKPILGICRGLQEINVALGGSLHQLLHEVPGKWDHRGGAEKPLEERFAPRHHVSLSPGGQLADIANGHQIVVNSLHGQGIDRLAKGLSVEAIADDGTIEAITVDGAEAFAIGVQWHPEWKSEVTTHYRALFKAFGAALNEQVSNKP